VPPLLEREPQLRHLAAALAEAGAGDGRMVLIGGEAGLGKSSLVEHLARMRAPLRALLGTCDPQAQPLAPFLELAGALEPSLPAELSSSATPAPRLFAALSSAPHLLIVEDVHWADQATLDVLRYLGRRVTRLPALILATFRSEDAAIGSLLGDLATAAGVSRMELAPLSESHGAASAPTTRRSSSCSIWSCRGRRGPWSRSCAGRRSRGSTHRSDGWNRSSGRPGSSAPTSPRRSHHRSPTPSVPT